MYTDDYTRTVFNLVHDTDVQAMNARIEQYMAENAELIQHNTEIQVFIVFLTRILLNKRY